MAWFKVDDQLAFNAKVMLAGNSAMGLWVRAGSWSSAQLTGGHIPVHMANAMANAMANPCDADALVMAGLWSEVDGGYQFHDWADFQPDAEVEKEKRKQTSKARSDAGKAGAAARWAKENDGKPDGKRNSKTVANEWQTDAPVPSRPDQTLVEAPTPAGNKKTAPKRRSQAPESMEVTPEMRDWAKGNNITTNLEIETAQFLDHHASKGSTFVDWKRAWQSWMRNSMKYAPASAATKPGGFDVKNWMNQ